MTGASDPEADTVSVKFTVSNARAVSSKTVFALVDVELSVAGVVLEIFGIQARCEPDGQTSIRLPTYKNAAGLWRPAIRLPAETHGPLADAVLEFLIEEGLARRKFEPAFGG